MPSFHELKKSKFLTKEDVGKGVLVTITGIEQVDIAKEGAEQELRWSMSFNELEKPLILNMTNGSIIAAITGEEEMNNWIGSQIVLFNDPTVMFAGKMTGGIRVRAAKPGTTTTRQPPKPDPLDDVSF